MGDVTELKNDHVIIVDGRRFYVDTRVAIEMETLRKVVSNAAFDLSLSYKTIETLKAAFKDVVKRLVPTLSNEEIDRHLNVLTGDNE